ncbi:hypothetical protein SO802_008356 [Lithocarpus litseifolius]|uniref:NB-ARC domain-containing protein n=1 Tax=Lithocarpus litseifolius TaxID=425828 RepID=A0AAW2D9A8_9ROSI
MFRLKDYHVEPPVSMDREETHSFVLDEKFNGREDDKKAIIKLLLEPNNEENVSIIPIVGIGGSGKTTLAQSVYNDKKIQFELKMWICISDVFDVKMIIQKIILATGMEPVDHSMDKLQDQLRKIIHQKKYLLVLDDVWNEDPHKWDSLKDLLACGTKGSKIVIITCARLVAEITCPVSIYTLKGLNEEQSWLLFKQIAFRKKQGTNNPRLEAIGWEIVHKCQGIPLGIKSIGNVLRLEKTKHKWSYVKNNILESATQQKKIDTFPILKLSYDHLPSHLKSCFAFCSLFLKDYEIDKGPFIQLWIVQGFIRPSSKNQELEDVADEYFKDLLWRSFFEEVANADGDINEEVPTSSFFQSLKSIYISHCPILKGWWRSISTTDYQQHPHHQSLPSFHHLFALCIEDCPNLTSLPPFPYLEESLYLYKISLKPLQRTIAMNSPLPSSSSFLSSPFSKLKSITLISIKDTEALPDDWMSNLSSLKKLYIQASPKLKSLSLAVPHLTSLKYLEISNCKLFDSISDMGDGGIEWQYLKCLSSLHYESVPNLKSIPSGLQHVTTLRRLVIFDYPDLKIFPELTSVVYLQISGCPNLTSIPNGISKLTSLEELYISHC